VPLLLSIVALIVVCGRRARVAGWLLAPYLAWVSFAAYLNLTIVRLNGPFG
jgi:tryptophan-rich sensory protein